MNRKEFELMVQKAIHVAPDWLKEDIHYIVSKDNDIRISEVISKLFNQYSFNLSHIFASMHRDIEWASISRERLTFIDNNLDLIDYMVKAEKGKFKVSEQ